MRGIKRRKIKLFISSSCVLFSEKEREGWRERERNSNGQLYEKVIFRQRTVLKNFLFTKCWNSSKMLNVKQKLFMAESSSLPWLCFSFFLLIFWEQEYIHFILMRDENFLQKSTRAHFLVEEKRQRRRQEGRITNCGFFHFNDFVGILSI